MFMYLILLAFWVWVAVWVCLFMSGKVCCHFDFIWVHIHIRFHLLLFMCSVDCCCHGDWSLCWHHHAWFLLLHLVWVWGIVLNTRWALIGSHSVVCYFVAAPLSEACVACLVFKSICPTLIQGWLLMSEHLKEMILSSWQAGQDWLG